MKRMKLTLAGRLVVFVLVAALVVGAGVVGVKYFAPAGLVDGFGSDSLNSPSNNNDKTPVATQPKDPVQDGKDEVATINLSVDEWIGWEPILHANNGLSTQPGSIFDKMGLKVNIHVINDADASSNALIKGDLDAAGYTINRTAFLSGKFEKAGLDVVMPVFTNYSDGGDGIIALSKYNSIESLLGAKIGVPRHSEAQSLVIWLINKSDKLTDEQKMQMIEDLNKHTFDDAEQTGLAFFAGELDAAATWQPYLSNAENSTNSHILFDTSAANNLILDGILFRADFAKAHPEVVSKFIDGVFQALETYESDFDTIRKCMPMFSGMSDDEIASTRADAGMMNYAANLNALKNICPIVYSDMCNIWESINEEVDHDLVSTLFDTRYLDALSDKYSALIQQPSFEITEEQKEAAIDAEALLTKSTTINFMANTAKFLDSAEASKVLKEFVDIAKTLDGTIIQIEGNINTKNASAEGIMLSENRAKTVRDFFVANGIDPNRIIVIGNGNSKMIADPDSEDAYMNRRTDVFFKIIEE